MGEGTEGAATGAKLLKPLMADTTGNALCAGAELAESCAIWACVCRICSSSDSRPPPALVGGGGALYGAELAKDEEGWLGAPMEAAGALLLLLLLLLLDLPKELRKSSMSSGPLAAGAAGGW